MNNGTSALQCTQRNTSILDGVRASSPSQYRHLKWMVEVMKPVVVTLLLAVSLQAQSLADAARQEKERKSKLQSKVVIAVDNSQSEPAKPKPEDTKPADAKPTQETPKPQPAPVDPVKLWNEQLDQLRAKIRGLQDREMALLLQLNEVTNQVYAVVTDATKHEKAQSQLTQIQEQVATVRKDLLEAQKSLDGMMLSGPPKK
jgi:hypothetical protein